MAVNLLEMTLPGQGGLAGEGDGYDPQMRRKLAEMLLAQSMKDKDQPIRHWTQGAAHMVDSLTSALMYRNSMREQEQARKQGADDTMSMFNAQMGRGQQSTLPGAPPVSPMTPPSVPAVPDFTPPKMGEMSAPVPGIADAPELEIPKMAMPEPAGEPNPLSGGDRAALADLLMGSKPGQPTMPNPHSNFDPSGRFTGGVSPMQADAAPMGPPPMASPRPPQMPGPQAALPEPSPPGPLQQVRGPALPIARDTMPPAPQGLDRSRFKDELNNPEVMARLLALTHAEVGSQGREAQQALQETIFNRAAARNQSLMATMGRSYYEPLQTGAYDKAVGHMNRNPALGDNYRAVLADVVNGSNVSKFATGNASGTVGFNGGPQVAAFGGERYGIEGPDRKWAQQVADASGRTPPMGAGLRDLPPMTAPKTPDGITTRNVQTVPVGPQQAVRPQAPAAGPPPAAPPAPQQAAPAISPGEVDALRRMISSRDPATRAAGMQMLQQYQKTLRPPSDMERAQLDHTRAQTEALRSGAGKSPAGYRTLPNGNMEAIPGGPADLKHLEKRQQDATALHGTESTMAELERAAHALSTHRGLAGITGLSGKFPNIPGGAAADAQAQLETLKAKTAFAALQAMRDASKSGGALGSITERELAMLQNSMAPLERAQSIEQMREALGGIVRFSQESRQRLRDTYAGKHGDLPQHGGPAAPKGLPAGSYRYDPATGKLEPQR